jgi:glutamate-ammonia-ligase adenylyltransferase
MSPEVCAELTAAYHDLRGLEHRVQMMADDQTHKLPDPTTSQAVAALCRARTTWRGFDAASSKI